MKKIYIPISILNLILLFILINTSYLVINVSYGAVIILPIITILIFEIINYTFNRNRTFLITMLTTIIIFITYLVIHNYSYLGSLFNNLVNLIITIDNLTAVSAPVDFLLIRPLYMLILPIITTLYLTLFRLKLGKLVILINTLMLLLFNGLGFEQGVKATLPLYIFLIFINYNLFKLSANVKKHGKTLVVYYIIVSVIISSVTYWNMPSRQGKLAIIAEKKLKSTVNRGWNDEEAFYNDMSDYASIGMNKDSVSSLGKKVKMNNKRLALVSGDLPQYLRTRVYYEYYSDIWTNKIGLSIISDYNQLNVLESSLDDGLIKRNIDYNKDKGSEIKTLSVQPSDNNFSDIMISPNYITKVVSPENSPITFYNDESYLVGKDHSNYSISYYDYSDAETFESFSETSYKNDINNLYEDTFTNPTVAIALNFTSSQSVFQLAHEITSTASSNNEKLELIQDYLLNNFSYNLKPNPMTNSNDYVEFFLFNEKKGYCQSFASAAVMLCRAVGIPARYVEGFKVTGNKNIYGSYLLKASNAHAWCEVLTSADKGIWSILETTPGYQSSALGNSVNSNIEKEDDSDTEDDSVETNNQKVDDESSKEDSNTPASTDDESNISETFKIDLNKIFKNYKSIILGIGIVLLFILLKLLRRNLIIKKIIRNESLIPLYTFILKRLKTIKITKRPYETEKEFALRIKDKLDIEFLIDALYRESYGNENTDLNRNSIISITEGIIKSNSNAFIYYMLY